MDLTLTPWATGWPWVDHLLSLDASFLLSKVNGNQAYAAGLKEIAHRTSQKPFSA